MWGGATAPSRRQLLPAGRLCKPLKFRGPRSLGVAGETPIPEHRSVNTKWAGRGTLRGRAPFVPGHRQRVISTSPDERGLFKSPRTRRLPERGADPPPSVLPRSCRSRLRSYPHGQWPAREAPAGRAQGSWVHRDGPHQGSAHPLRISGRSFLHPGHEKTLGWLLGGASTRTGSRPRARRGSRRPTRQQPAVVPRGGGCAAPCEAVPRAGGLPEGAAP